MEISREGELKLNQEAKISLQETQISILLTICQEMFKTDWQ